MIKKKHKKYPLEMEDGSSQKQEVIETCAYIKLKLPVSKITEDYEKGLKEKLSSSLYEPKIYLAIREDAERIVKLYNRSFLTSGTPFRIMTPDIFEQLYDDYKCEILIAKLYGIDVGFMFIDYEGENNEYGIISGLGIISRFRRKGIATALALEAWKRFLQNHVKEIRCEVFITNKISLNFVKSLGFEESDLKVFMIE